MRKCGPIAHRAHCAHCAQQATIKTEMFCAKMWFRSELKVQVTNWLTCKMQIAFILLFWILFVFGLFISNPCLFSIIMSTGSTYIIVFLTIKCWSCLCQPKTQTEFMICLLHLKKKNCDCDWIWIIIWMHSLNVVFDHLCIFISIQVVLSHICTRNECKHN